MNNSLSSLINFKATNNEQQSSESLSSLLLTHLPTTQNINIKDELQINNLENSVPKPIFSLSDLLNNQVTNNKKPKQKQKEKKETKMTFNEKRTRFNHRKKNKKKHLGVSLLHSTFDSPNTTKLKNTIQKTKNLTISNKKKEIENEKEKEKEIEKEIEKEKEKENEKENEREKEREKEKEKEIKIEKPNENLQSEIKQNNSPSLFSLLESNFKQDIKIEFPQNLGSKEITLTEEFVKINLKKGWKWVTLSHNGVLFPPEYEPHGIKLLYKGQPVELTPRQEECATMYAKCIGQQCDTPLFKKNFFQDFKKILDERHIIQKFEFCDFSLIKKHLDDQSELRKMKRKNMDRVEKKILKEEREEKVQKYKYAMVDGRKEKIGNFRVEPPGLFRGRGKHPFTGKVKARIRPEDITINIGKNSIIPTPPNGGEWKEIVHQNNSIWIAKWIEPNLKTKKYVFFSQDSSFHKSNDMEKYEKARKLKKYIGKIRKDYEKKMQSRKKTKRQLGTALWIIDKLAIRGGGEKNLKTSADTVGCTTLRVEHIKLKKQKRGNFLCFDFLGKDSMRYVKKMKINNKHVWENLKKFVYKKRKKEKVFDFITLGSLNKYLKSLMPSLSAKVFRTFNASYTLFQELKRMPENLDPIQMLDFFQESNRKVAILCNHQRSIPKSFGKQLETINLKLENLKTELELFNSHINSNKELVRFEEIKKKKKKITDEDLIRKRKSNEADGGDDDDDDDDDDETDDDMNNKSKQKETEKLGNNKKTDKNIIENSKDLDKVSENNDEIEKIEKTYTVEQLKKKKKTIEKKILKLEQNKKSKENLKGIALGTSKINYIDPRIIFSWTKKYQLPIKKIYSQKLIEKFSWANTVSPDWKY
ncbi:DNA topoisomerase [Anaeramoeba flamelloides]|uniref:DNA topoisomerase 1 n=1 Tax=Anaeramoeba flamelloides TaxID=1746091 RepID=A0AAV7ZSK6_9EUKA|nr:DNA topoisomerase [Anaeramoeba flamelloides]